MDAKEVEIRIQKALYDLSAHTSMSNDGEYYRSPKFKEDVIRAVMEWRGWNCEQPDNHIGDSKRVGEEATGPVHFQEVSSEGRPRRDPVPSVWDMSQEREFLETLLNQRFNFFVVFFSAIIAGATITNLQSQMTKIWMLGLVIELLLWPLIFRAQHKLNLIVKCLSLDERHPMTIIDNLVAKEKGLFIRLVMCPRIRSHMIGSVVPSVCCCILIIGAILSMTGTFSNPQNGVTATIECIGGNPRSPDLQSR